MEKVVSERKNHTPMNMTRSTKKKRGKKVKKNDKKLKDEYAKLKQEYDKKGGLSSHPTYGSRTLS